MIDEAQCTVLLYGHHLLHHFLSLGWATLGLDEGGSIVGAHHMQLLYHQCARHKPGHPKDFVDAAEAERRIIVVVGIEVVNVIVNLCVVVVSVEVVVINVIVNICTIICSWEC
jgi:hypothetical protein